ncbi:hypothetical protein MKZ38_010131 [Zalerion maritima]|uniref:Zn(2)-C6 fungal-type domain-containing protein n=1 Tax=Zalerion maritima TaxID=339359 RepID=A0AAD5WM47_9PEZI|nr:hypothetical protein MKZ38_010131 [Zalerion maritima]
MPGPETTPLSPGGTAERQIRRRRRPALSCLECRRRKTKCDRNEPCSHCVNGRMKCSFQTFRQGSAPPHQAEPQHGAGISWTSTPTPSSSHHAPAQVNFNAPIGPVADGESRNNSQSRGAIPQTSPAAPGPRRNVPPEAADPNLFWSLLQRVQKLESSSSPTVPGPGQAAAPASASRPGNHSVNVNDLSSTGRDILTRQSGLQHSQVVLDKSRVLRWSHWLGTAKEFTPIIACYTAICGSHGHMGEGGDGRASPFRRPEIAPLVTETGILLQKCKSIARALKTERPSRSLFFPSPNPNSEAALLDPPPRDVSDTMVSLYFDYFESTHRILHAPTFRREYEQFWDGQAKETNIIKIELRLKILLVVGLGFSLYDDKQNPSSHTDATSAAMRPKIHHWIHATQTWLSGPLEKDRLDIQGLQIHCLAIMARQVFSVGGDLVWMTMGSLMHKAMQMGLHRDPKHIPRMSILEAETRRRLWASILEMIAQSSLDSAMPPRISDEEYDTSAPGNFDDDEIDTDGSEDGGGWDRGVRPRSRETFTQTSMQLLLLDSLATRLRILRLLNGLKDELSYLDVPALSSEITDFLRASNKFASRNRKKHPSSGPGTTPFHRALLDYLVRRFLIPLHCPFASIARSNPLFHYSLAVSLDSALALISPSRGPRPAAADADKSNNNNNNNNNSDGDEDDKFAGIMAIGGGLFREGIRYASTVVSLELLAQTEAQARDGTLHSANHVRGREVLKAAVRDTARLSVERIRKGETNVKSHMFLAMILAQADAMEDCGEEDDGDGDGDGDGGMQLRVARSARDSVEFCHELLKERLAAAAGSSCRGGGDGRGGGGDRGDLETQSQMEDTPGLTLTTVDERQEGFDGFDMDLELFLPDAGFS